MKKGTIYTTTATGRKYAYPEIEFNHSLRDAGIKLCKENGTGIFTVVDFDERMEYSYNIACPGACVCATTF